MACQARVGWARIDCMDGPKRYISEVDFLRLTIEPLLYLDSDLVGRKQFKVFNMWTDNSTVMGIV